MWLLIYTGINHTKPSTPVQDPSTWMHNDNPQRISIWWDISSWTNFQICESSFRLYGAIHFSIEYETNEFYPEKKTTFAYVTHMRKTLTHWGRVTHICVGILTIIGSDNGLSPGRRRAGILLIGTLRTNFGEILFEIDTFSFKKMYLKMSWENGGHRDSALMC